MATSNSARRKSRAAKRLTLRTRAVHESAGTGAFILVGIAIDWAQVTRPYGLFRKAAKAVRKTFLRLIGWPH
jgi:hypothetical protein